MSAQPLPGLLASLAPVLDHYGYFAVGGFITLEDFGIPVPGETILIAAAVYAGAGRLNIFVVGLVAVLAAVVGDNIGYAIGFFGGRPLVLRYGRYVHLTSERLDKAEAFFARYGGVVVAGARFIEGLRQANGIVAGVSRMAWPRFLAFNALGAVLWVAVWTSIGYLAGSHITAIYNGITRYSLYVLIALGVVVAALVIRVVVRRRRARRLPRAPQRTRPGGVGLAVTSKLSADDRGSGGRTPVSIDLIWGVAFACRPTLSEDVQAVPGTTTRGQQEPKTVRRGDTCHDISTARPLTEVWPR
jgi:membrane protein DedA with SNARE-associated domain